MAQESSFDIVSKVDLQEVRNAVSQAMKEVQQRFDFKGSKAQITLNETEHTLELRAEDDTKLKALGELLRTRLAKRQLPMKAFDFAPGEVVGGGMRRQDVKMQNGITSDKAREIVKLIKNTKRKVQAAIQAEQIRVSGKAKDDLQAIMTMLRADESLGIDMQFVNYR